MRPHPSTKKPMLFLVAVALMALIASPSVAADRDAELIESRFAAESVRGHAAGAGGPQW
jgi:hypothetical protein